MIYLEYFLFILYLGAPITDIVAQPSAQTIHVQPTTGKGTSMRTVTKGIILLTLGLLPFSLAACVFQPVSIDEAQAAYCDDLAAYNSAVEAVHNLPEGATVEEFEAALDTVNDAWDELENSAWEFAEAQTDALESAQDVFRDSLDAINSDTTLEEARAIVTDSVEAYKLTYAQVRTNSCASPL
jgi:hypothetical protein